MTAWGAVVRARNLSRVKRFGKLTHVSGGEFCGYLRNAAATKNLLPLFGGVRKLAGKEQGILPHRVANTPHRRHFHRQTTIEPTPPRKP